MKDGFFTEAEANNHLNITDSTVSFSDNLHGGMITGTTKPTKVTIKSSTLTVNNNTGNGSNGGNWDVSDNSVLTFEDNGDHGLSAATLKVGSSEIQANRNGANGIMVTSAFNVNASKVYVQENVVKVASRWTNPGALYVGGTGGTVTGSVFVLTGNDGPALHSRANLAFDDATDLTITGNRAFRGTFDYSSYATSDYQRGAGVHASLGSLVLPADAQIFNNRALLSGDDIYVAQGASIQFGPAHQALLDETEELPSHPTADVTSHIIDGWYIDEQNNRWMAHPVAPAVIHLDEFTGYGAAVEGPLYLKAAHTLTTVVATKQWVNGPEADHTAPDFILVQDGVDTTIAPVIDPATGTAPTFTYTWSNLPGNGDTYVYTVREDGVVDGELTVGSNIYTVEQVVVEGVTEITNTYQVPLIDVEATKRWVNGPEADHMAPTFVLVRDGVDQADVPVVAPATGPADSFTYTWTDLREKDDTGVAYVYTVREDGVVGHELMIGTNRYAVQQTGNNIVNSFVAPPPTPAPTDPPYPTLRVPLNVQKVLRNGSLQAGAYTFELRDATGKVIATATNAADGTVSFPDRTFSRVVTNYLYTIREVQGTEARITYDKTIYTVKVTTTPVSGQLTATVAIEKDGIPYAGGIVFTNVREMPSTGDSTLQNSLLLLTTALVLGGVAILLGKRRKTT